MRQTAEQVVDEGCTSRGRRSAQFQKSYNQGTSGHIRARKLEVGPSCPLIGYLAAFVPFVPACYSGGLLQVADEGHVQAFSQTYHFTEILLKPDEPKFPWPAKISRHSSSCTQTVYNFSLLCSHL